jgi:hypothetical protein
MTNDDIRTNFCATCKEQADRIEAQAAEIERLKGAWEDDAQRHSNNAAYLHEEIEQMREALDKIAAPAYVSVGTHKHMHLAWREIACRRIDIARDVLGETE